MKILNFFKKAPRAKQEEFSLDANRMMDRFRPVLEEMWILSFLSCRDMTALQILDLLHEKADHVFCIIYPMMPLYELTQGDYIRKDQHKYLSITPKGKEYLSQLRQKYELFLQTNEVLLSSI